MKQFILGFVLIVAGFGLMQPVIAADVVNDVTQLNPIVVDRVVKPSSVAEIQALVRDHNGPISIGGGRYSMGGQIATQGTLFIDMKGMNHVLNFDQKSKLITVEPGITWKEIQSYVDPYDLSVKIMQTYNNFTVGGSLSVNVHGRYIGYGPLVLSVRQIKVVLADGTLVTATPTDNNEIFYSAIGGYGGIGVIVEATLELADNVKIERSVKLMPISEYHDFFIKNIRNNPDVVFHNGDIYPPDYTKVSAVTWTKTDKALTDEARFRPIKKSYALDRFVYYWITEWPFGYWLREHVIDPWLYADPLIVRRNYEASYDVKELEPKNRKNDTYVLQEYFAPVDRFDEFVPKISDVMQRYDVKAVNISIRHAKQDSGTVMAWARQEVFAFVLYYKQGTSVEERDEVGKWTRELIDDVIAVGGRYYLPYQPLATQTQFETAYPDAHKFFDIKRKLDPTYKFRNKLWDKYYPHTDDDARLQKEKDAIVAYARPEDQTFLTIPEWYIVFSSEEYANALAASKPSDFPYMASISQFWDIYDQVKSRTESAYQPNPGYHLMIKVIGVSYATELFLKSAYEHTIGWLTEWMGDRETLQPDMQVETLMYNMNKDYVAFIKDHPWYEYKFMEQFKKLQRTDESDNTSVIRSMERRLFFGWEMLIKAAYGALIEKATHATYVAPDMNTWAVVTKDGKSELKALTRYQRFSDDARSLAAQGYNFVEIAGNKQILFTVITSDTWKYTGAGETFCTWPILTEPGKARVALVLPVSSLGDFLRNMPSDVTLDHIFDY